MEYLSDVERLAVKDRFDKWSKLKDFYNQAENLKLQGEENITLPIDIFLLARDIPKNMEKFYNNLFLKTNSCFSKKSNAS